MGKGTDAVIKIKLCLLAAGLLILALLLARNKKEEGPEEAERQREEIKEEEQKEIAEDEPQIKLPVYNGNIRVLLKTDRFASEYHREVELIADHELVLLDREEEEVCGTGTRLFLNFEDGCLFLNGEELTAFPKCLKVRAEDPQEQGKITVKSLKRSQGAPAYEGCLEIWIEDGSFVLINELPLETYLKYVVPSEMPSRYESEALKAQAVCARTYAYGQMRAYAYPQYEAHVDDSVGYQVYNNTAEAEASTKAVEETGDLILTSKGEPILAYYFSTSCGHTGNQEIWWDGSAELTPYLKGKSVNESGESLELWKEESFAEFISQTDESCYDAGVSWYRWELEAGLEELSENLDQVLERRIEANPQAILTKRGREYVSRKISSVGKIEELRVLERNQGGAITKLEIIGRKRTVRAETEYNVRALLNVEGGAIVRKDGSVVESGSLLPSACMTITPLYTEEGELKGYRFYGGGYGHGVGLSQNGANQMAKLGKDYGEILRFFYTDVELTAIHTLW